MTNYGQFTQELYSIMLDRFRLGEDPDRSWNFAKMIEEDLPRTHVSIPSLWQNTQYQ